MKIKLSNGIRSADQLWEWRYFDIYPIQIDLSLKLNNLLPVMESQLQVGVKNRFKESSYKAARIVAPIIKQNFAEILAAKSGGIDADWHPDSQVIEAIIDAAFWASLRKEEGISPRISLALLPPEQAGSSLLFEHKIILNADTLTKLAPGVERPGIHIGVWYEDDLLYIWGTTHNIPDYCLVVDVSEPGLLVIKHRRMIGFGKFVNIAVLNGDQIKVIDQNRAHFPESPAILSSLLGSRSSGENSVNVHIQLAVSMRAHQRGGILLVVPSESDNWLKSILQPIKYSVFPSFNGLADLFKQSEPDRTQKAWQNALSREISSIGGLTAVDGATVVTDKHELLAFGAKIVRPRDNEILGKILKVEPITGFKSAVVNHSAIGGTRHVSAAQFVHDQRDALALVASQDGHFTVFTWSASEDMVQAHRIDTLLL